MQIRQGFGSGALDQLVSLDDGMIIPLPLPPFHPLLLRMFFLQLTTIFSEDFLSYFQGRCKYSPVHVMQISFQVLSRNPK